MKNKILTLILLLFVSLGVFAQEQKLKYEILTDSTVEVSDYDYNYFDSRDSVTLVIPEKVRIDGKSYSVVGIGKEAFLNVVV